jgi:hypothetical protein
MGFASTGVDVVGEKGEGIEKGTRGKPARTTRVPLKEFPRAPR